MSKSYPKWSPGLQKVTPWNDLFIVRAVSEIMFFIGRLFRDYPEIIPAAGRECLRPLKRSLDAKMMPKATKNNNLDGFYSMQKTQCFIGSNVLGGQRVAPGHPKRHLKPPKN